MLHHLAKLSTSYAELLPQLPRDCVSHPVGYFRAGRCANRCGVGSFLCLSFLHSSDRFAVVSEGIWVKALELVNIRPFPSY